MDSEATKYNVFALNSYEKNSSSKLYKLLITDTIFSRHNDSIKLCDTASLKSLYTDDQYNFCNLMLDKDKAVWLSQCKPSIKKAKVTTDSIVLDAPQTIWEFLWDILIDADLYIDNKLAYIYDISFSSLSTQIRLQTDETSYIIWSVCEDDYSIIEPIHLMVSLEFYNKWKDFVGNSGSACVISDKVMWEVKLHELKYKYSDFYMPCRFFIEELQYLLEKYLLIVSRLRGIEIGYWLMNKLNGINYEPRECRYFADTNYDNTDCVRYYFEVNTPDVKRYCHIFSNAKDVYSEFVHMTNMDTAFMHAVTKYDMPYNNYFREFLYGFLSQISLDKNIVYHHEHDAAIKQHREAASLAERIFAYKFCKIWDADFDVHIHGGILQIGVINES